MEIKRHHINLIIKSFLFYKKDYLKQMLIVALLASIITGSLLTGESVRESLKRNSREKLGNTHLVASSGLRFFDPSLSVRLNSLYGLKTVPLFETTGYCQNFSTGATALNVNIYGVNDSFFRFHGTDSLVIPEGTIAINIKMAGHLDVSVGDELILRFREADPIPENAPFAPDNNAGMSRIFRISYILDKNQTGNFSLRVSQAESMNIFLNQTDAVTSDGEKLPCNRILAGFKEGLSEASLSEIIKKELIPSDIGFSFRISESTGETEMISDRVFIDSPLVSHVLSEFEESYPVITYLANTIRNAETETPYSFVCGIFPFDSLHISDNEILINEWLANDLHAAAGDKLELTWYYPEGNRLEERSGEFTVKAITGKENLFSDPSLMPEFPGISGSTSCSSWDAGIPILMERIRDKDEDYWDRYRGTPKAFVNYATGRRIWGNDFGTATAIRFPVTIDKSIIENTLKGSIDLSDAGITVSDAVKTGEDAASQGVDFGTLFLSLGFFIILSSVILLSFTISIFFDSKREQIRTLYSLGFRNKLIANMLFIESFLISITGAMAGIISGYLVNYVLVTALNSVWTGAVQTDSISPVLDMVSLLSGFVSTVFISQLMVMIRLRRFLSRLAYSGDKGFKQKTSNNNLLLLLPVSILAISLSLYSAVSVSPSILLSFTGGILIFFSLLLMLRQYYLASGKGAKKSLRKFSRYYYRFNLAQAMAPVVFIASGIFAILITSSNRLEITDEMLLNQGGTGGYLLWGESAIPVPHNLATKSGRDEFGLNENDLKDLDINHFVRLAGDDASCLNLNQIKSPPLLGVVPEKFIDRNSFSFASVMSKDSKNPWLMLGEEPAEGVIYGIADQTVIQWGLIKKTGDTLIFRTERGQLLKIVICGGLKSSVFQGHLLMGEKYFREYFPSVPGSSVFLFDSETDSVDQLINTLSDRFSNYGLSVETAEGKLASFFVVTNTYLNVFTILGILGLILGVAGLGFMLIRNYDRRKREFSLLYATGFNSSFLRNYILTDHIIFLTWGIITGTVSAVAATYPTLKNSGNMSYNMLIIMILSVFITGLIILWYSVGKIKRSDLVAQLRKE